MKVIECNKKFRFDEIREDDTDDILRLRNNPAIRNRFTYRKGISKERHLRWLKEEVQARKAIQYIIIDKDSDRTIGSIYLKNINWFNHNAEYGIVLGGDKKEDLEYEKEIAECFLQYAYNELKLHKIYLKLFPDDAKSIEIYESIGFKKEGILRKDACVDGIYQDMIRMGKVSGN